ncbi:hypothetical protein ACZ91_46390 [Streptomyces regensis]|nr:hypothetical protein ACZ91_46390 [Streptomyces regensis]
MSEPATDVPRRGGGRCRKELGADTNTVHVTANALAPHLSPLAHGGRGIAPRDRSGPAAHSQERRGSPRPASRERVPARRGHRPAGTVIDAVPRLELRPAADVVGQVLVPRCLARIEPGCSSR